MSVGDAELRWGRRTLLFGIGGSLLGGCAVNMDPMSRPATGAEAALAYERRLAQLAGLTDWDVRGRMALRTSEEDVSARVAWAQTGERYRVQLSNPLGQTLIQLTGAPGRVSLRDADGNERAARSPEALLEDVAGWSMPVSALRHWLLGRPDPGAAVDALDTDTEGRPVRLRQAGWDVEYTAYREFDGVALPTRVNLVRDGAAERANVSAKLILRGWRA